MALPRRRPKSFPVLDPNLFQSQTQDANRVLPRDISSGNMGGTQTMGGASNVRINSSDGNITTADANTTRILIGRQVGGF